MRSTMQMSTNTAVDNILDNYSRLLNIQNQMARGRRVLNPSDDPLAVNEGIRLQTVLEQIGQYTRNIEVGDSFLGLSDSALQTVNDLLGTAKALTVSMANDATTPDARAGSALEVANILSELVSVGNRMVGDRYIFAGTNTDEEPFEVVGSNYVYFTGNVDNIALQVDRDTYTNVNTKASDVFGALITGDSSVSLTPRINMDVNTSTRLSDLNNGDGVSNGVIHVRYQNAIGPVTYEDMDVDLTEADTLEDVADIIYRETNGELTVTANGAGTGLIITNAIVPGTLLEITDPAGNTTARDIGIVGSEAAGVISGSDLNPNLTERTLLSDILGYHGSALTISNGTDSLANPVVGETSDINSVLSRYSLSGLDKGVNTGSDGELYFNVTSLTPPMGAPFQVEVFKDATRSPSERVAVGQVSSWPGTVILSPDNGSGVGGTVSLDNFVGDDLSIEATVQFPEVFSGTVQVEHYVEAGDTDDQVRGWEVYGLRKGVDTGVAGDLVVNIEDLGATREVRLYNADTMTMIASGTIPQDNGTVTLTGAAGYEHVSGSVQLEYLNDDTTGNLTLTMTGNTVKEYINAVNSSGTYTDAEVTSDGRYIRINSRLSGATLHLQEAPDAMTEVNDNNEQLTRWNLSGIQAGINSDVDGSLYVDFVRSGGGAPFTYTVNLYSDSARSNLVATGSVSDPLGAPETIITITEAPNSDSGIFGVVNLRAYVADDNDIVITPNDIGISGKFKADNVFSTLNDVVEAGYASDGDALHDLIGNFDVDINRILDGRGQIGASMERLDMLTNRLADESTSFTAIMSDRIDLDYADAVVKFQQESNIYNASLAVAGQIIPMSLIDFI